MSILEEHPIGWWWNPNVSPETLGTMLTNNKGRLVSLSPFMANSQLRLAAVWVSNTGSQNKAWWWNPNVDAATLGKMLDDNKGRLVSLNPYVVNGKLRLAAVWVSNTGADKQAWWWNPNVDPQTLGEFLTNNKGRLVCLNSYVIGNSRRYSAVWVSNTGPHQKAWWWNPDVDAATLGGFLKNNEGRLVSLDPFVVNGTTRFAAVWVHNVGQQARAWWWYYGTDGDKLGQKFDLFCSYAADLRSYVAGGKRRLASVIYAYPSDPNPSDAKLVKVTGSATLTKLENNIPPQDQVNSVKLGVKNLTSSAVKIKEAEILVSETGGWVDYRKPFYGNNGFFKGQSQELTAGQGYDNTADLGSGLGVTHCVVRLRAEQGSKKQYSHTRVPIVRAGYTAPPDFPTPEPLYIGGWVQPAEIVPMWVGKETKWLTVGGQFVNGSGQSARVAGWHIFLEVDGKVYLDQALPMNFRHFDGDDLVAVPKESDVPVLADFLSYFVHGFEVAGMPKSFKKGTLRLVANYKVGDRCGAAVHESPVVFANPVTLKPPVGSGLWRWGNSPNHSGFDAHAWPGHRFSVDIVKLDKDGNSFSGDNKEDNESFYCYGEPVLAMADGTVVKSHDAEDENFGQTENKGKKDINYVLVEHAPGAISGYYHLRKGQNTKAEGEKVKAGEKLGEIGNSGGSSEPHLHIGYLSTDETGRARLRPMQFSGLKSVDGTAVVGVPGTETYEVGGVAAKVAGGKSRTKKSSAAAGQSSPGPKICRPW